MGDDLSSDDGEEQQSLLKRLNFPAVEKEQQPSSLVPKVSTAIQKRLSKLDENLQKLLAIQSPNSIQNKLLWIDYECFIPEILSSHILPTVVYSVQ